MDIYVYADESGVFDYKNEDFDFMAKMEIDNIKPHELDFN